MNNNLHIFADKIEGTIEYPMSYISYLERELDLSSPEKFLVLNLIFFILVSMIFLTLIIRARHISIWLFNPLLIMMMGIWMSLIMSVECRAGITDYRVRKNGVIDLGHQILEPVNLWAAAYPSLAQLITSVNTIYCIVIIYVGMWMTFYYNDHKFLLTALPSNCIRMIIGVLTRMPIPEGYIAKPGDWPPPSPHCPGFILNPSGHVMNATLVCLSLFREGKMNMFIIATILNVAQAFWLVATRGHYTVDIITALLICASVEHALEEIMTRSNKYKKIKSI